MAKSARASSKKANKARLRTQIYRPVEDARTARLSARLLELAESRLASEQKIEDIPMDDGPLESADVGMQREAEDVDGPEDDTMDLDSQDKKTGQTTKKSHKRKVDKRRKQRNSIVFPTVRKRRSVKSSRTKTE